MFQFSVTIIVKSVSLFDYILHIGLYIANSPSAEYDSLEVKIFRMFFGFLTEELLTIKASSS